MVTDNQLRVGTQPFWRLRARHVADVGAL